MAHQPRNRFRIDNRIGIDGDNNIAHGLRQRMIERSRFAAIWLQQQTHARVAAKIGADELGGAVGGTVVYHQDLEFRISGDKRRANRIDDDRFLVICRNHHSDFRLVFGMIRWVGPEFFGQGQ